MKTQVFSSSRVLECFFVIIIFFLLRKCPLHMLLVMFFIHLGKLSNSRSQMFFKAGVLKNFAIFAGKRLCWRLFLIYLQDLRLAFSLKKTFQHGRFPMNIARYFYGASVIIRLRNFMWWCILDIWSLNFTIVKLGHVPERTSRQIEQNFLWRYVFFSTKISILLQIFFCYLIVCFYKDL